MNKGANGFPAQRTVHWARAPREHLSLSRGGGGAHSQGFGDGASTDSFPDC